MFAGRRPMQNEASQYLSLGEVNDILTPSLTGEPWAVYNCGGKKNHFFFFENVATCTIAIIQWVAPHRSMY